MSSLYGKKNSSLRIPLPFQYKRKRKTISLSDIKLKNKTLYHFYRKVNPLISKTDQHLISPCNITTEHTLTLQEERK